MAQQGVVRGRVGGARRGHDGDLVDRLEHVHPGAIPAGRHDVAAGADVYDVATAAAVEEEAVDGVSERGRRRAFGGEEADELTPVRHGYRFVDAHTIGRGDADEAGRARAHRGDRPGPAGNLLDVDAGRQVARHVTYLPRRWRGEPRAARAR